MTDPIKKTANVMFDGLMQFVNELSTPPPQSIHEALTRGSNTTPSTPMCERDVEVRTRSLRTGFMTSSANISANVEEYLVCVNVLGKLATEQLKRELTVVLEGTFKELLDLCNGLMEDSNDRSESEVEREQALLDIDAFVHAQKSTYPQRAATYVANPKHLVEDLSAAGVLNEYYLFGIIELGRMTGMSELYDFSEEEIASLLETSARARSA